MNKLITATLLVVCSVSFAQNLNSLWKSSTRNSNSKSINKTDLPLKHLYDLDINTLKSALASSPKRDFSKTKSNTIISLPNGDGKLETFRVYENSVMDPALAAKYPEIKSYVAVGIDNPSARAYFSNSPLGLKSMTLYADDDAVFIEPISTDLNTYTIYKKSDKKGSLDPFECNTIDQANNTQKTKKTSTAARYAADDGKLRTLRLALSCTGEYAAYFGGTKSGALAGINNTITRINGVYERDFGIKLILAANNDAVIFTDPSTDPYSNTSYWKTELQSNLTTIIGEANYDIGHLFGTSAGNLGDAGCRGCVCTDNSKGSGYTCASPNNFSGESFDIEFVAHEMGHQLGASHTFTYKIDNDISQMEPGSGSTIMSYAGSTSKDIQIQSDTYFHAINIQQVTDNIKTKSCPVIITTGNAVPIVNAGLDFTIPKGTPFLLTGSATDANTDDVLTYTWEEMDLGNATTTVPSVSATVGPLFRSYSPVISPTRYFPNMTTVLSGFVTTSGIEIPVEVLPGVARTLNFRLTVRDNRAGGSANNTDDMMISVDGNSGPFNVDSQNSAASYATGTTQTINWTVAGTNANGVNCANVDVLLSTDGGKTFSITLLSATPNSGAAQIVIPNIPGTTNRIMVKGTNQIFFDVNNINFTITGSGSADTTAPTTSTISVSGTTASGTNLSWTSATDNVGVSNYNVYQNGVLKTTTTATSLIVADLTASTAYSFYVKAKDAAGNLSAISNTANVTTLANTNAGYCSSYGSSTVREYINKVQIGTINNVTGNNNGYGNFTSTSTNLPTGTSNTIVITPAWSGTAVNEAYRVWIDFNQDGDFDDSGELVFSKSKTKATTVSGSLTIPTTVATSSTRMRVSMKNNILPNPCEIFSYGEVEDYTVNIISGATARIANTINEVTAVKKTTNNLEVAKLSFKLYPNPVKKDVIYISDIDSSPSYVIYNMMGAGVAKGVLEIKEINVSQLVRGIYILELNDGKTTTTKRFIKL